MPQINQLAEVAYSQFFWLLLTLGIIYFVIAKGMVPKVQATVEARDKRVADDLAAAQRARAALTVVVEPSDAADARTFRSLGAEFRLFSCSRAEVPLTGVIGHDYVYIFGRVTAAREALVRPLCAIAIFEQTGQNPFPALADSRGIH